MIRRRMFLSPLLLCAALALPAAGQEGLPRRERLQLAAQAQELMAQSNYEKAAELLEKAVAPGASKSDLVHWYPVLGRCYEVMKNYQKALGTYQEAQRLNPKSVDRMLDLARVYDFVGLDSSAIELYQKVLKRDKNRRDVVFALANIYFRSGQTSLAREYTQRSLRWDPQDPAAQRLMARVEEAQGDLAAAAHRWEGLLAQSPAPEGYFHLGLLWARQNQYDLAEIALKKAKSGGVSPALCEFHWGLLEWHRGNPAQAEKRWKEALRHDPDFALPKFFLALSGHEAGRLSEALALMNEAEKAAASPYVRELCRSFRTLSASTGTAAASSDGKN